MNHSTEERSKEMKLAIELWQESGLSKYAFCKREKLSRATFNYWLVKYGYDLSEPFRKKSKKKVLGSKTKKPSSFVAVNLESQSHQSIPMIELEYPNGVKLRLAHDLGYDQLQRFITMY